MKIFTLDTFCIFFQFHSSGHLKNYFQNRKDGSEWKNCRTLWYPQPIWIKLKNSAWLWGQSSSFWYFHFYSKFTKRMWFVSSSNNLPWNTEQTLGIITVLQFSCLVFYIHSEYYNAQSCSEQNWAWLQQTVNTQMFHKGVC